MRKFFSCSVTSLALVALVFIGYLGIQTWLEARPGSSIINRPTVGVADYTLPDFTGTIGNSGYDISWPQCRVQISDRLVNFVIIGLNHGKPLTTNPCFESQWQWARKHDAAAIYINTSDPGTMSPTARGKQIASDTLSRLRDAAVAKNVPIWLDVETHNTWTDSDRSVTMLNTLIQVLHDAGHPVGIYSTPVEWFTITMGAQVTVPTWLAIGKYSTVARGVAGAKAACEGTGFGDARPAIVQFVAKVDGLWLDRNIMCTQPNGLVARP